MEDRRQDVSSASATTTIPLRELILDNPSAKGRVTTIMDITSCGLADIETFRKQGYGLIVLERFVLKHERMPSGIEEIQAAIDSAGTMYL